MQLMMKRRPAYESKFAFTSDTMLVSYARTKNKTVLVMSTMHEQPDVHLLCESKKPYAILDYNATKGALDSFDQETNGYACSRRTRRWPMRLFYFLVDAAAFNAYVIWTLQNPTWRDHAHSVRLDKRRVFLMEVGHELIRPLITHRSVTADICHQPSVSRALLAIGVEPAVDPVPTATKKRGRCQSCLDGLITKSNTAVPRVTTLYTESMDKNECIRCPLKL